MENMEKEKRQGTLLIQGDAINSSHVRILNTAAEIPGPQPSTALMVCFSTQRLASVTGHEMSIAFCIKGKRVTEAETTHTAVLEPHKRDTSEASNLYM